MPVCYCSGMVKKLVSKSEFARMAGVSPAAVTKASRGLLQGALVGKRIDAASQCAIEYIQNRVDAPTGIPRAETAPPPPPSQQLGSAAPPPPPSRVVKGHTAKNNTKKSESLANLNNDVNQGSTIHEIPDDIKGFADMTLRELIQRFGTDIAFLDWLKATKSIEDINEKRLKNAATRGELVNRDLIKVGVIEPFDTVFNKLLTDGAKTIARRVCAMNGAGRAVDDCEKFVAGQISSFIKPAKAKIARTLKNA